MKILVLNCGSSSVKYKLLDMTSKEVLGSGGVEKIGMKGSFLKHTKQNGEKVILEGEVLEHQLAIEYILGVLTSTKHGCIKNMEEIDAVGHRVVHGGEKFNSSVVITDEVIRNIEACIEIAPLHNPPNLAGIFAISDLLPQVPQVAVFDTAFHQTAPSRGRSRSSFSCTGSLAKSARWPRRWAIWPPSCQRRSLVRCCACRDVRDGSGVSGMPACGRSAAVIRFKQRVFQQRQEPRKP